MFGIGMCLYVFYCLCYEMDISTYIFEDQVSEEIYPDLNEEEYIRLDEIMEDHWRDVAEEQEVV